MDCIFYLYSVIIFHLLFYIKIFILSSFFIILFLYFSGTGSMVTAIVYWRPSDLISLRALAILKNLHQAFPTFFTVVAVLAPKYPSERILSEKLNENKNNDDKNSDENKNLDQNFEAKNSYDSLLIPSEIPDNILLDASLESWTALSIKNSPTVFICLKKNGDNKSGGSGDESGSRGKIIFALESQRTLSEMVSKALSAVLTVIQYDDEKKEQITSGSTEVNTAGVGMWGKNFEALWTPTPVLPTPGTAGVKKTLSRPMRLTVNNKNGMLYIADSGTFIILQEIRNITFACIFILSLIFTYFCFHLYIIHTHFFLLIFTFVHLFPRIYIFFLYFFPPGNHRVLEVDASKQTPLVTRIFGSSSGISGTAAAGTTVDKMLLNKYVQYVQFCFSF